jgi:hypothetical protein
MVYSLSHPIGRLLGCLHVLHIAGCEKNEPIDEAKAAGRTTADFPQITAGIFKPVDRCDIGSRK